MRLSIVAAGIGSRDIHRILKTYPSEGVESKIMSDFEAAKAVEKGVKTFGMRTTGFATNRAQFTQPATR